MHGYPRGRSLKAETKFDKGAGTQEVTVQCASGANFMPINRPSIKFQGRGWAFFPYFEAERLSVWNC